MCHAQWVPQGCHVLRYFCLIFFLLLIVFLFIPLHSLIFFLLFVIRLCLLVRILLFPFG